MKEVAKKRYSLPAGFWMCQLHVSCQTKDAAHVTHIADPTTSGTCRKNSKVSSSENPSSSKRAASSRAASSTPFGLTSGQSQGTAAAPPATDATGAAVSYGRVVYTEESLSTKIQSDLKQICQKRSLPVSGKKKVLIDRILTGQLGTGS